MPDRLLPLTASYHCNRASALLQAGRPQDAVVELQQAIEAAPQFFEPHAKLAQLLLHLGRAHQAMEVFEQAVSLDPHLRSVCRDTTALVSEDERCNAVLVNCDHILARYPHYAPAHYSKACALLSLGHVDEARKASERALVIDATVPTYYHVLIHTGDPVRNAPAILAMEQLAQQEAGLGIQERATLHFLLAKAYEDKARYGTAFAHMEKANSLKRSMIEYSETRAIEHLMAIGATFSQELLAKHRDDGDRAPQAVFVVGMPRSGTTLIEQILASHRDVHGAGELSALPDLIAEGLVGENFPTGTHSATPQMLHRLGERYNAKLKAIAPRAKRVIDKLPTNFQHVGLIHLALPGARIIHIQRDPLDTCLSCYATTFAGGVNYAYDLGELGHYYRAYDDLMGHWRNVLPQGAMLEVQYEAVVQNLEQEARRIVAFCSLDWDQRCLDFHKNERAVATASLYQVRQPLYRNAIGRAASFGDCLDPLRAALGPR